jgi:hypothetical protein
VLPPNCPQAWRPGTKKASRQKPESLEIKRILRPFDVNSLAEREGFEATLVGLGLRCTCPAFASKRLQFPVIHD